MVRDERIEIPASSSRGLSLVLSGFMSLSAFAYASPLSGTGHSGNSPPSDCEALLEARDDLEGSGATRSLNRADDTPVSQWYGVAQSGTPKRVTQLRLHGLDANAEKGTAEAKLNGTIPAELGLLGELTVLYLYRNNLTGAYRIQ